MTSSRPSFALTRARCRAHLVDRLATRLRRVGLEGVLADLDSAGERSSVPGEAAAEGFTWNDFDRKDETWWPQGVVSLRSGDLLLVSWYAKRDRSLRTPGSRVSVVDRTDPARPRYRHVRLVVPRRRLGFLTTGTVAVHAGGIAVHGDVLLVADTFSGLRVFRLGDAMAVPRPPAGGGRIRLFGRFGLPRRSAADGDVGYVLPQVTAFRVPLLLGPGRLRFSFLSIGEVAGQANIVVGEYRRAADRRPRLVRYALDPGTGLPACDEHGRSVPLAVHEDQPSRMQGAAVHGSDWFLTASAGRARNGDLYTGTPGAWRRHRGVLPSGPEDLDWSRPGDELWCVSEWPGQRWVFPIATDRWRRRPGEPGHAAS